MLGLSVLLTFLWNLKGIQNSRQNRSKNKLVRENAVTWNLLSSGYGLLHGCICLRVLKESNKGRFDCDSVRNSVLIISYITYIRDYRVHVQVFLQPFSKQLYVQSTPSLGPALIKSPSYRDVRRLIESQIKGEKKGTKDQL